MNPVEISAQLRKPSGTNATAMGERMTRSNANVIAACIELLQIAADDNVLEIGPGSGAHISSVVSAADNVRYVGIDWSAAMVADARKNNQSLIEQGVVTCCEGNAIATQFNASYFDKVFSVNTIYFWENPQQQLGEISRILRPDGIFCLAFGDRGFMQALPFTKNFTLYSESEATGLLESCGFTVLQRRQHTEVSQSNANEQVSKRFHLMRCGRVQNGVTL